MVSVPPMPDMTCPVEGKVIVGRLDLAGMPLLIGEDLMAAYATVFRRHGYTDVSLLLDGTGRIAAIPPGGER